jgi:hypothetical protein
VQHAGKAIVAGGVSGAIEICCTYPLEFTKTVSQLDKGAGGAMGVVRNTLRTSGPIGFYRGLSSMVYFATPKAAIRFSAFEQASGALVGGDGKPMFGSATAFVAGLIAGTAEAIVVTTPQETIKIKLIDDAFTREVPRFNGFFHGVSTIIKEEGLAGIYAGVAPTILKARSTSAAASPHAPRHDSSAPTSRLTRCAVPCLRARRGAGGHGAGDALRRLPLHPPRVPQDGRRHSGLGRLRRRCVGVALPVHRRHQVRASTQRGRARSCRPRNVASASMQPTAPPARPCSPRSVATTSIRPPSAATVFIEPRRRVSISLARAAWAAH